jgi:hypothetical protein
VPTLAVYPQQLSFLGLLVVSTICLTPFLNALRIRHMRYLLTYPPAWVATVGATSLICLVGRRWFPHNEILNSPIRTWILAYAVLFLAATVGNVFAAILGLPSTFSLLPSGETLSLSTNVGPKLAVWLSLNEPIEDRVEDRFGLAAVVTRIMRRLADGRVKTLAILGPHGCGKTSLRNLLTAELRKTNAWICCVSGWGLSESSAAEFVLGTVLDELAKHVDCTAIASLPAHYQNALKATQSTWSAPLTALLASTVDPMETLYEIDAILGAVGMRLVIFLEDLDRNNCPEKTLGQVTSLLDRLRKLRRVCFVLAISAESNVDFVRLCDHLELFPSLPGPLVAQVVQDFENFCRSLFPDDIAVVQVPERSTHSLGPELSGLFGGETASDAPETVAAMAGLLTTPRALKSALRQALATWEALHGEINLEDLITVSALRAAAPNAYRAVIEHMDEIRAPSRVERVAFAIDAEKAGKERSKRRASLFATIGKQCDDRGLTNESITYLLEQLFPDVKGKVDASDGASEQRIRATEPTDYWRRLLAEDLSEDLSDQKFLRAIQNWRQSEVPELLNGIENEEEWCRKLEQFGGRFTNHECYGLASHLFTRVRRRFGVAADDKSSPGFLALWRVVLNNRRGRRDTRFVRREITESMGISLRFSLDVEYYWACFPDLFDRLQAIRTRRFVCLLAKKTLSDPAVLAAVLDPTWPWSLHQLVRGKHLKIPVDRLDWSWLPPVLLRAALDDPDRVVPNLAVLVTVDDGDVRRGSRLFDDAFIASFFGVAETRALMRCLTATVLVDSLTDQGKRMVTETRQNALSWLADHPEPPVPEAGSRRLTCSELGRLLQGNLDE